MDNNKAKLKLAVYRRTGADANDPFFAEALQQAEKDPGLREWLAEQQAFDAKFAAALGEIHGPKETPTRWAQWARRAGGRVVARPVSCVSCGADAR